MPCRVAWLRRGRGSLAALALILLLVPGTALPMRDDTGPGSLRNDPALFPPAEEQATLPADFPENLPAPGAGGDALPAAKEPAAPEETGAEPAETFTAPLEQPAPPPTPIAGPGFSEALTAALTGPLGEYPRRSSLRTFYTAREHRPLWLDPERADTAPRALLAEIHASEADGLDPDAYHEGAIGFLLDSPDPLTPEEQARLELLLTDGFLQLADHLSNGLHRPNVTDPEWFIPVRRTAPEALLEQVANGAHVTTVLDQARPSHPAYVRLKQALEFYRALVATGGLPALPPGKTLELGMRNPRVATLRQHLQLLGDAPAGVVEDAQLFDNALMEAVSRYQERHGLEPDGRVGRRTRAALNVPASDRVEQIRLNLERWRWLPRDMGERYILVNVAGFELELLEHDQPQKGMRVIIGQKFQRTPAFTERMTYLEVNPYWNVPEKIAREELIPKLETDPEYLDRQNIRILSDWSSEARIIPAAELDWTPEMGGRFPYRLQQLPGPHNALGRIKFMFPNPFSIYLHDTPSRNLFRRTVRTFSHGCIRVEKPMELADWVLAGSRWEGARIRRVVDDGAHKIIGLPKPIPVYVVYLTAWVDQSGRIQLRNDVYGRDRRMTRILASLAEIPPTP